MHELKYSKGHVRFLTLGEYYYALGFLTNSQHAKIQAEHEKDQTWPLTNGHIDCLIPRDQFPPFFYFEEGEGDVCARINCNEYIEHIVNEHKFSLDCECQNYELILLTVPGKFIKAFSNGYNGQLHRR